MQNIAFNFISIVLILFVIVLIFFYLLVWQFSDKFVCIVFVIFVDTISITGTIPSDMITEESAKLFKYLLFS